MAMPREPAAPETAEIRELLGTRVARGQREYLVSWVGYDESHNSYVACWTCFAHPSLSLFSPITLRSFGRAVLCDDEQVGTREPLHLA